MQATDLYTRVSMTLQDMQTPRRWEWDFTEGTETISLQPILNQAIETIASFRPDATSTTEVVALVKGAKQELPTGAQQLIEILRNMGSDGSSPGKAITKTTRSALDAFNRDWMNKTGTSIEHWIYDITQSKNIFWVCPAVPSGGLHVEMIYSQQPTKITAQTDEIPLSSVYFEPIYHHMLFQIFAGESEDANFKRGMEHWSVFKDLLGLKQQTDKAYAQGVAQET